MVSVLLAAGTVACSAAPAATPTATKPPPATATPEPTALPDLTDTPEAAPSTAPPEVVEAPVVAVPTVAVGPDLRPLPNPNTVAVPPPGACQIIGGLPDHACTPGLLNPRLTPVQLCARGFSTKTIRPPTSYSDVVKRRLMAAYGQVGPNPLTGRPWSPNDVELDHAVSLEDLGHPWSPLNLWPQPRRSTGAEPNAEEKDQVEVTVHELICADESNAGTYAARLAADWTQFRRTPVPAATPKESEP